MQQSGEPPEDTPDDPRDAPWPDRDTDSTHPTPADHPTGAHPGSDRPASDRAASDRAAADRAGSERAASGRPDGDDLEPGHYPAPPEQPRRIEQSPGGRALFEPFADSTTSAETGQYSWPEDVTDPSAAPGPTAPGRSDVDPAPADPTPSNLPAADPHAVDPYAPDSQAAADPRVVDPYAPEPQAAADSRVADPHAADSPTDPQAAESPVAESEAVEPHAVESQGVGSRGGAEVSGPTLADAEPGEPERRAPAESPDEAAEPGPEPTSDEPAAEAPADDEPDQSEPPVESDLDPPTEQWSTQPPPDARPSRPESDEPISEPVDPDESDQATHELPIPPSAPSAEPDPSDHTPDPSPDEPSDRADEPSRPDESPDWSPDDRPAAVDLDPPTEQWSTRPPHPDLDHPTPEPPAEPDHSAAQPSQSATEPDVDPPTTDRSAAEPGHLAHEAAARPSELAAEPDLDPPTTDWSAAHAPEEPGPSHPGPAAEDELDQPTQEWAAQPSPAAGADADQSAREPQAEPSPDADVRPAEQAEPRPAHAWRDQDDEPAGTYGPADSWPAADDSDADEPHPGADEPHTPSPTANDTQELSTVSGQRDDDQWSPHDQDHDDVPAPDGTHAPSAAGEPRTQDEPPSPDDQPAAVDTDEQWSPRAQPEFPGADETHELSAVGRPDADDRWSARDQGEYPGVDETRGPSGAEDEPWSARDHETAEPSVAFPGADDESWSGRDEHRDVAEPAVGGDAEAGHEDEPRYPDQDFEQAWPTDDGADDDEPPATRPASDSTAPSAATPPVVPGAPSGWRSSRPEPPGLDATQHIPVIRDTPEPDRTGDADRPVDDDAADAEDTAVGLTSVERPTPDAPRPSTERRDTARPTTDRPSPDRPGTGQPDPSRPDTGRSGSAAAGAAEWPDAERDDQLARPADDRSPDQRPDTPARADGRPADQRPATQQAADERPARTQRPGDDRAADQRPGAQRAEAPWAADERAGAQRSTDERAGAPWAGDERAGVERPAAADVTQQFDRIPVEDRPDLGRDRPSGLAAGAGPAGLGLDATQHIPAIRDTPAPDTRGTDTPGPDTQARDTQGRDPLGRDAPGRDAPGRDGQGRDGQGRDGQGRDGSGRNAPGQGPSGLAMPGRSAPGQGPTGLAGPGQGTQGQGPAGTATPGQGIPGLGVAGLGAAGLGAAGLAGLGGPRGRDADEPLTQQFRAVSGAPEMPTEIRPVPNFNTPPTQQGQGRPYEDGRYRGQGRFEVENRYEEHEGDDDAWDAWAGRQDGPDRLGAPDEADAPVRPRRRKSRRGLVIGGVVVVVLAVAAGVLFGVPGVASKVGLGGVVGPPVTADPPSPVAVSSRFGAPNGPSPSPAGVAAALAPLAANPQLGTLSGEVLDASTGATLWNHDSGTPLTPASTNKVLTSAAALLSLDPQSTFDTKVVAGSTPGTVVLVGGGDPTLSAFGKGQFSVYTGAPRLDDLAAQVKASSQAPITKIVIDESRFIGSGQVSGWDEGDIAHGNGGDWTPIVPAMLDGGRVDPTAVDGARTPTPGQTLGQKFAADLGVSPSAVTVATTTSAAPAGAKQLGIVHSQTVQDLVTNLLQISDNVLAETLGRAVAKADGKPQSFQGATEAIKDVLQRNGFDVAGLNNQDASGLSTADKVPAALLASVLRSAAATGDGDAHTAKLRPLLTGLPVGGGSGTLQDRFSSSAAAPGKGWVRAKTGTLTGVNTLAGLVLDSDGHVLVFALMSNNPGGGGVVENDLDVLAATLRGCGCR